MNNKFSEKPKEEGKEGHFMALLFATFFSLVVGLFAKKLFLKWCRDNDLTEKEGFILLFVFCWIVGLVLMVLTYVIALLMLLFQ